MKRIDRIAQMEQALDASAEAVKKLSEALEAYESVQSALQKLSAYYGSAQWLSDFEADEAGKLPADLKRGVLSEDAVFDLLEENRELVLKMLRLAAEAMDKHTF